MKDKYDFLEEVWSLEPNSHPKMRIDFEKGWNAAVKHVVTWLREHNGDDLDCAMIAERNERERILGIIEELSFYDDIEKAHILIEMELIEKIKR